MTSIDQRQDKPLRRIVRLALAVVLGTGATLIGVAACFAVWVIGTSSGLSAAVSIMAPTVKDQLDVTVSVGGVSGSLRRALRLEHLRIDVPSTVAIEATDLSLEWRPLSLLEGRLNIIRLSGETLDIRVSTQTPAGGTKADPGDIDFELPFAILLEQLHFPTVSVAMDGEEAFEASAVGRLETSAQGLPQGTVIVEASRAGLSMDRLEASFSFIGDARQPDLAIDVVSEIAPDGLVASMIGLPSTVAKPARLKINGEGPSERWLGSLVLHMDDVGTLSGDVALLDVLHEEPGIDFSGKLEIPRENALELQHPLTGDVEISFLARLDPDDIIDIGHARFRKPDLAIVEVSGTADIQEETFDMILSAELASAAVSFLGEGISATETRIDMRASGNMEQPDVDGTVVLHDVATEIADAVSVSLGFSVSEWNGVGAAVSLRLEAAGFGSSVPGLAEKVGTELRLSVSALVSEDLSRIDEIAARVPKLGVELDGSVQIEGDRMTIPFSRVTVDDLADVAPLVGEPLAGALSVDFVEATLMSDGSVETEFSIEVSRFGIGRPEIEPMIGDNPTGGGALRFAPEDGLHVTKLYMDTSAISGSGEVSLAPGLGSVQAVLNFDIESAAMPVPEEIVLGRQRIPVSVQLAGDLSAPSAKALLPEISGTAYDVPFRAEAVEVGLLWDGFRPKLDLSLRGSANDIAFDAKATALMGTDALLLDRFELLGNGFSGTGVAEFPGYDLPVKGQIELAVDDPVALSAAFNTGIEAGRVRSRITLSGSDDGVQLLEADGTVNDLVASFGEPESRVTLSSLKFEGSVQDALKLSGIRLRGQLGGLRTHDAIVDDGVVSVDGRISKLGVDVTASGTQSIVSSEGTPSSYEAEISAQVVGIDESGVQITLDTARVGFAGGIIALNSPASFSIGEGNLSTVMADVGVAGGTLILRGEAVASRTSVNVEIKDVDFGTLSSFTGGPNVEGRLNAELSAVQLEAQSTSAWLTASLRDITVPELETDETVALTIEGRLSDGRVSADINADGPWIESFVVNASMPVAVSLLDRAVVLGADAPLDGGLDARVKLEALMPYLPLAEHSVSGEVVIDAAVSGPVREPEIAGSVTLHGIQYEHLEFGTVLRNLVGRINLSGPAVDIGDLEASDLEGGRLTVRGRVSLSSLMEGSELSVSSENFQFVRTDAMKLSSDTSLRLIGLPDGIGAKLDGELVLTRGEVNLSAALPPSIPTLDVETESTGSEEPTGSKAASAALKLNVLVQIPGQLFVRGRGVDSEWEGDLRVTGDETSPRINGLLTARRGRFDVLGKTFQLRDSSIRFSGGDPIDPLLNIRGVAETSDNLTVITRLTGPASNPEIVLESEPTLPRDEILSRLLFGKSTGRLNAVEAAQLAVSAAELSGGGGGPDILGALRRFVGVDVLQVDAGEAGPAVRAGRYLSDGVYVGAKQGTAPGSGSVEVEVEITPNISVNTESGSSDSNTGVQFKWDY